VYGHVIVKLNPPIIFVDINVINVGRIPPEKMYVA